MNKILLTLFALLIFSASCKKDAVEEADVNRVCLKIQHHQALMPDATVYFKYNDTVFPGYDLENLDIFDASFQVGTNGEDCFEGLPLGNHWLVAHGWDADWPPDGAPYRGSIRISLTENRYQLDSIIYVQEY